MKMYETSHHAAMTATASLAAAMSSSPLCDATMYVARLTSGERKISHIRAERFAVLWFFSFCDMSVTLRPIRDDGEASAPTAHPNG